jgi:hypothetical protein
MTNDLDNRGRAGGGAALRYGLGATGWTGGAGVVARPRRVGLARWSPAAAGRVRPRWGVAERGRVANGGRGAERGRAANLVAPGAAAAVGAAEGRATGPLIAGPDTVAVPTVTVAAGMATVEAGTATAVHGTATAADGTDTAVDGTAAGTVRVSASISADRPTGAWDGRGSTATRTSTPRTIRIRPLSRRIRRSTWIRNLLRPRRRLPRRVTGTTVRNPRAITRTSSGAAR